MSELRTIPLEAWAGLFYYILSVLVVCLLAYCGLKFGLKGTKEKLEEHLAADKQSFEEVGDKLDRIVNGIADIKENLGDHQTQLSLHDERTKRTADTLIAVELKLDMVRLNQERLVGRFDTDGRKEVGR